MGPHPRVVRQRITTALQQRDDGLAFPRHGGQVVRKGRRGDQLSPDRPGQPTVRDQIDLARQAWRRTAINTEAKLLMLGHAFEAMGYLRVEFKADSLNERSRAALMRIGAYEEGPYEITRSTRMDDPATSWSIASLIPSGSDQGPPPGTASPRSLIQRMLPAYPWSALQDQTHKGRNGMRIHFQDSEHRFALLRQVCQSGINQGTITAIEPNEDVVDCVDEGEARGFSRPISQDRRAGSGGAVPQ